MKQVTLRSYGVWFMGALFFLYEYFVRVLPSVLDKTTNSPLTTVSISSLATALSTYFLIYSPMQLFVGPLFDTFGGRKLFLINCLLLSLGCLLPLIPFGSLFFLGAGRFVMGFSSAFGFVGVMYLCATWFPRKHLAMLSGLTTALGLVGTISSQVTFSYLHTTYQAIWVSACLFGLLITLLLFFFLPKDPHGVQLDKNLWKNLKKCLSHVAKKPGAWVSGIITGALYMPFGAFADLWSIPYLTKVCHFTMVEAAQLVSILNISWAISCPIMGWFSDAIHSRKKPLVIGGIASGLCFCLLLMVTNASFMMIACLMALLGICCGVQVIGFVACADLNPENMSATSVSFNNMLCMILCGIGQPMIGCVIDRFNQTHLLAESYRVGLSVVAILIFVSVALFGVFYKEKRTC